MKQLHQILTKTDRSKHTHNAFALTLKMLPFLFLGLITFLALDVLFHLSPEQRIQSCFIYLGIGCLAAAFIFWSGFIKKSNPRSVARELENKDSKLGSSLINTLDLEIQIQKGEFSGGSKDFAEKAISDYAEKIDINKFKHTISPCKIKRQFKVTALLFALFTILCFPITHIIKLEILRHLDPHGDHPPFSLTQLEITSPAGDPIKVVYGEDLLIKALHKGHRPKELFISFAPANSPEDVTTLPMFDKGDAGFSQKIEKLQDDLNIYVHTESLRSISKTRKVKLILTPKVSSAQITITSPEYTGIKMRSKKYNWKNVSVLKGSKVKFTLKSNRPLKGGTLTIESQGESKSILMKAEGQKVSTEFVAEHNARLRFSVEDISGLKSVELLKGSVSISNDNPPSIHIILPEKDSFVSENYKLKIKFEANDDYGISEMRLHRALNGFYGPPKTFIPDQKYLSNLTQNVAVPIKDLGIKPGDIISFYVDTMDNSPEGQMASSKIRSLKVVTVKDYNDYLRKNAEISDLMGKYEKFMFRLGGLIEEQQKVNEKIRKLKQNIIHDKAKNSQEQLNELISEQNQINHKLQQLSKDMKQFGRKNPLYDVEKQLTEHVHKSAKAIQKSVDENQKSLEDFSKESDHNKTQDDAIISLQKLESAGHKQLEQLGVEKENYTEDILSTMRDLTLMNELLKCFNKFTELYRMQTALTKRLRPYNIIRELSRSDKLSLKRLAGQQKYIGEQIARLQEELVLHSQNASFQFPQAAQSAQDLALAIDKARLIPLAEQALNSMLLPDGPESYQLAEKLRRAMEKMFNSPQMPNSEGDMSQKLKNEFDRYLSLMREMNCENTFDQMNQCRKFGFGRGLGNGAGIGYGAGSSGRSGYAGAQPQIDLLGNEEFTGDNKEEGHGEGSSPTGKGDADGKKLHSMNPQSPNKTTNPENASSHSVESGGLIQDYETLIEAYMEKLTEEEQ